MNQYYLLLSISMKSLFWNLRSFSGFVLLLNFPPCTQTQSLVLSARTMNWADTMKECQQEGARCVVHKDWVNQWTRNFTVPPPDLPVRKPAWVAASAVQTLVWKISGDAGQTKRFFRSEGCYQAPAHTEKTYTSYGPFTCYDRCRNQHWQLMALQGTTCHCLNGSDLLTWTTADGQCPHPCLEQPYSCGGVGDNYQVYDIPVDVILETAPHWTSGCFVGQFRYVGNTQRIVIKERGCQTYAKSINLCGNSHTSQVAANAWMTGEQFQKTGCSDKLLEFAPENYRALMKMLFNVSGRHDYSTPFWLSLERRETIQWNAESPALDTPCVALLSEGPGKLALRSLPCSTELPHLTCCEKASNKQNSDVNSDDYSDQFDEAVAVGVVGVVILIIFLVIAVTLYVLKRMGLLRVRQKPTFNSTGDWDQPDTSAAAHALREHLLALNDLHSTLPRPAPEGHDSSPSSLKQASSSSKNSLTSNPSVLLHESPKPLKKLEGEYVETSFALSHLHKTEHRGGGNAPATALPE